MSDDLPDPIVSTLRDRERRACAVTVGDRHGHRFHGRVALLGAVGVAEALVTVTEPSRYYGRVSKEWTLRVADVAFIEDEN